MKLSKKEILNKILNFLILKYKNKFNKLKFFRF
jgi:hypothetical protein